MVYTYSNVSMFFSNEQRLINDLRLQREINL